MGIEEEYDKLKRKHGLPEFKAMDRDFEVSAIEKTGFLLREINANMMEKLEFVIGILSELIQPDTNNLASMHEFRMFDDDGKKELYDFYGSLMTLHRKGLSASISGEEKGEVEFLKEFHSEWKGIKSKMAGIVGKMGESWEDDTVSKTELGYLG
ncbi:hypothetical protein HY638_03575 [Candidatus Woesearchaeota archaeon]|nr:hypothetical protein [Candidatus Woesearchaeota archaeon]